MKKKIFAILIMGIVLVACLVGCNDKLGKIQISAGSDNSLATLILTDICFDGTPADTVREKMITKMVNDGIGSGNTKDEYEFIAITGNMVNCEDNGKVMKKAAEFIDSFGIPWAMSIGERDVKGKTNKKGIINILTDKSLKNSLVMRGDSYDYNYCLEVVKSDKKVNNLFYFLDTSVPCDDKLVDWYRNVTKNKSFSYADVQGKLINSHIFMNRALPIFEENANKTYEVKPWAKSDDLQKAIFSMDSTKSIIAGFDEYTNGARFNSDKGVHIAYVKSMYFNSSMTGDNYKKQADYAGCSYQKFGSSTVYLSTKSYSPENYKNDIS